MSKYFVTGGAGFIGSHLGDRLLKDGHSVTVYDNLISGRLDNIKQNMQNKNFRFIKADLLDLESLKDAMKGIDVVWHLGANTDIPGGTKVTDLDLKSCTIGTYNTLEAMKQTKVNNIIFASSACVYGDESIIALDETYGPLLPINLYGAGKLACEGLISAYSSLFGIKARMFRFGNVVGARMGHGVIYDFIHKLEKNPKEMEILGDGKQEKNFFLVEDCISGMLCGFQNSNKQCDIFTLGTDTYSPVTRIAKIVAEEMNLKNVRFTYAGGRSGWPGDAPVVHFNTTKMNNLGWKPQYDSDGAVRIATRRLLNKE